MKYQEQAIPKLTGLDYFERVGAIMIRCKKCVLPETFPGITYDSQGVCSVCNKLSEQKELIPSHEMLKDKLEGIINENKSRGLMYDAVVAFSGGKDSTYLIYTLQKKYGLKILAVTFDNNFMSEHAFTNMQRVLENLNVDHMIIRPRIDIMKKIFLASSIHKIYPEHLTKYGSGICISCIRMVSNMALRVAIEKKIPMVMMGNSPGQLIQSENEIIYQDNKIPYQLRKRLFEPLANQVGDEVYNYLMLSKDEYKTNPFPYMINAFPIIGYDEVEIYKTINELGWKKPTDVDPNSTNCILNSLGIKKHKELYKFHPYDYEMSMLIRLNIIDREEALARVEDRKNIVNDLASQVELRINS